MTDQLALGALIASFLTLRMPGSPVKTLEDLSVLAQVEAPGHLIVVAYAGETAQVGNDPMEALITQRWLTVVTVHASGRVLKGDATLAKAGPLLWQISLALQGKQFTGYQPLKRVTPPGPRLVDPYSHFPLAWEAKFLVRGIG